MIEIEPTKIYDNKVPYDVRQEALRAIKTGKGLEAVAEANLIADEINRVSIYEKKEAEYNEPPTFELI